MSGGGGGFHEFKDKAASSHTYEGDGKEAEQFFMNTTNVDMLIDNMSSSEREAFERWSVGMFMDGQQYRGWDKMTPLEKQMTQTYDDILDSAILERGVVLTRRSDAQLVMGAGTRRASASDFAGMEGQLITSKGSMSFGAASQGLTIGATGKTVEYKLKIPGGTVGSGMWIGDSRINPWGSKQREFMTNRDAVFKVGKSSFDSARRITTVELTYMGHTEHDYGTSGRVR